MADSLFATLIVKVDGVRRSKTFELTTTSRSQVVAVSEALKLDRYLDQIDADYDGIQIPVDLTQGAQIGDGGFCHIDGAELPQSVGSNVADLKAAVTAAAARDATVALFISLA